MKISVSKFASLHDARVHYQDSLDEAIDVIRDKYYAKGAFIIEEYRLVIEQTIAYEKRHYSGPVPPMVSFHAEAMGVEPQHAAEHILSIKEMYEHVIQETCHARLMGQAAIALANTTALIRAAHDAALATLEELPPPQQL